MPHGMPSPRRKRSRKQAGTERRWTPVRHLLQEAINHATTSETAFNHLWDTHQRLGRELEKARATIAVLERPQPGDFVAGFILDTEGNTTYRVGKWPRPAAPTLQEKP
jgi:hypothetical protein